MPHLWPIIRVLDVNTIVYVFFNVFVWVGLGNPIFFRGSKIQYFRWGGVRNPMFLYVRITKIDQRNPPLPFSNGIAGCPKKTATNIDFQSILTRFKLNICERWQRGSFGFWSVQKYWVLTELWDFKVVLGLRVFWDTRYCVFVMHLAVLFYYWIFPCVRWTVI